MTAAIRNVSFIVMCAAFVLTAQIEGAAATSCGASLSCSGGDCWTTGGADPLCQGAPCTGNCGDFQGCDCAEDWADNFCGSLDPQESVFYFDCQDPSGFAEFSFRCTGWDPWPD